MTKWIGQAWEEVSTNKDAVVRGFKKCGISLAINGAEDDEINIDGIENDKVESDDDPFATSDDSDSSTDNDSLDSALSSGDEIVEDGLSSSDEENFSDNEENFSNDEEKLSSDEENLSSDEENFSSNVPFTAPFNSITFEEFTVIPIKDPDNFLENVTEDYFIV